MTRLRRQPLVMFNFHTLRQLSGRPSGISNYMFSLMRAMLDCGGFDLALCTSWLPEQVPEDVRSRLRFVEHRSIVRPRLLDVLAQSVLIPRIAHRRGVDLIVNVDPLGTPRGGVARVTVVHDVYFRAAAEQVPLYDRVLSNLIMRLVLGGSDRVVCVSETTKKDVVRYYPETARKAVRIYEDAATRDTGAEAPAAEPSSPPYLLFVGNLVPTKNIAVLYEALEILARDGLKLRAVVVGRDPGGLAKAAGSRLRQALPPERLENISDTELNALFRGATCLVNTSLYEGFCLPVVEAQRLGLPVICSREAAVGEVAGEGALLIDPRNADELAAALKRIFGDPDLRRALAARGKENAHRFSWSRTAREFEALLHSLLVARGRPPVAE